MTLGHEAKVLRCLLGPNPSPASELGLAGDCCAKGRHWGQTSVFVLSSTHLASVRPGCLYPSSSHFCRAAHRCSNSCAAARPRPFGSTT